MPWTKVISCGRLLGICCYRFPLAAYWVTQWLWIFTLAFCPLLPWQYPPLWYPLGTVLVLQKFLALRRNPCLKCLFGLNPYSSLPSLWCLEIQLCCPPIHVSPLLKAFPRVFDHAVFSPLCLLMSSSLALVSSQDSQYAILDFHISSPKISIIHLPGWALSTGKGSYLSAQLKCKAEALVILSNPIWILGIPFSLHQIN